MYVSIQGRVQWKPTRGQQGLGPGRLQAAHPRSTSRTIRSARQQTMAQDAKYSMNDTRACDELSLISFSECRNSLMLRKGRRVLERSVARGTHIHASARV